MIVDRVLRCGRPLALLAAALCAVGLLCFALLRYRQQRLPYHDSFASHSANEWQAFGGVWQIVGDTLYNRSDERGAKLITGSPRWSDYRLQTDVEMIGNQGDVGVIVRAGDVESGIDSYNGYYVGIRTFDSALVIGRSDHGWLEGHPVAIPGGVRPAQWYRLAVVVVGCRIAAQVANLQTGQSAWGAFVDTPCVRSGEIGVRSMGTGGAWRRLSVTRAGEQDWLAVGSHATFVQHPEYPIGEREYNEMREQSFAGAYIPVQRYPLAAPDGDASVAANLVSIAELREETGQEHHVRIRGVVTSADPLYIQDSTGGIRVALQTAAALNLGDEIEVTGSRLDNGYPARFSGKLARPLWDRTPVAPLSISTTQAASGAFDSSLVEVTGYLRSKSKDADGVITLQVSDASQNFTVVLKSALFQKAYQGWQPESWIRVAGVCVVGQPFVTRDSAFTLLARSPEDIEVLAGPPWWSSRRLLHLALPAGLLALLGFVSYIRLERWKMRGILNERERLAHEMHDTLAQSFAGVGFQLQGIRNSLRSGASFTAADMMHKLDVACELVSETHRDASATIAALHPDADEGRDLLVALENYALQMMGSDSLPISLSRFGNPRELSFPVRDALFQVGREAITNVIRHSRATRIELVLGYSAGMVRLEVRDNGSGFVPEEEEGFGMKGMRSRCESVGGLLDVQSGPDGTMVAVEAPYGARPAWRDWIGSAFWRGRGARASRTAS